MNDDEFGKIIQEAVGELPKDIKEKIENVAIVIADFATPEQMSVLYKRGERGMLLGLYEGIPRTKRGNYGIGPTMPDKITIFKFPLLQISSNLDQTVKNIKDTVIHEIAHHFGMSDKQIHSAKNSVSGI